MNKQIIINNDLISDKIHFIRDKYVILDSDLAKLYEVQTKVLKQTINRNKSRFPEDFMFILTEEEVNFMVSQNVTPSKKYFGGALPYVFTEQGVSMLAGLLRSKKAIDINLQIIRAFVNMRQFISKNVEIFTRLSILERKQIIYDDNFKKLFDALDTHKPDQGIFFEGEVFDAHKFVSDLIRSAKKSIILIDNFIDDTTLSLFSKISVEVTIYTKKFDRKLKLDLQKFNSQYKNIIITKFDKSHDRFLIIDNTIYHFGASLKDLGKKWFAFSKLKISSLELLKRLN